MMRISKYKNNAIEFRIGSSHNTEVVNAIHKQIGGELKAVRGISLYV